MDSIFGILYHAIGGVAAGGFYIPYKKVKGWSWETYWITGGVFSWILAPWFVSYLTVPDIFALFSSVEISTITWTFIFGMIWGIGGLTFGLTMRYLGMSLGYAMALGITAAFGTLIPPIYFGEFSKLISNLSGWVSLCGVFVSFLGITITGKAGLKKDAELNEALSAFLMAPPHSVKFILTTQVLPNHLLTIVRNYCYVDSLSSFRCE